MMETTLNHLTIIRHTLATLAYRTGYALHQAPDSFWTYKDQAEGWNVREIVAHMVQLIYAPTIYLAHIEYKPMEIDDSVDVLELFYEKLEKLDRFLCELDYEKERERFFKMYQGPISDAMTHVGQLMMLRRQAGYTMEAAKYFNAEIEIGKFRYEY